MSGTSPELFIFRHFGSLGLGSGYRDSSNVWHAHPYSAHNRTSCAIGARNCSKRRVSGLPTRPSTGNPCGCGPPGSRHSTREELGQVSRTVALIGCRQSGNLVSCSLDGRRPNLEFLRISFALLFLQTFGCSRAEVPDLVVALRFADQSLSLSF